MDMDTEGKIRSRIEAILINDARNTAEIKMMATEDEPLENDPFAEERNVYQRIITSYRNALREVNGVLKENTGFLSGLYRVIENIKEKDNFLEICSQIVDCVLQDLGAEYCGLVLRARSEQAGEPLYLEGVREQHKFLFSHGQAALLGSREFAQVVDRLADETADYVNIGDVYREPRFNAIDFPSVVRSLVCLPISEHQRPVGTLILGHSLPRFFHQNHARVLKILASMIAHVHVLTASRGTRCEVPPASPPQAIGAETEETLSVMLLSLESDSYPQRLVADKELIGRVRSLLSRTLEEKDSILAYEETGLLVMLPGTPEERLPMRAAKLRDAFEEWKAGQGEGERRIRLNLGYSTCESGEDLICTLETASLMMRADEDGIDLNRTAPQSERR
jgi:uncharacterized protein YigA (DUF484 family)